MREKKKSYSPIEYHEGLLKQVKPSLAFADQADAPAWQRKLRAKLREILAVPGTWDHAITSRVERDLETNEFTCDRVVFRAEPKADVPGYLLKPKTGEAPFAVMICLQGHSPGMHISIGRGKTKAEIESIQGGRDIAIQAVRNGWAALAIEQRSFGERHGARPGCADDALHALILGKTLTGERVFDVMRAIDFIAAQPDLDATRIGCMGNSAGGTVTFYAACVDRRIRLAVVSCSFCAYAYSWMKHPHCACGYLPGILQYADMSDLAGLIAPRHLMVVAGEHDEIAPAASVRRAFRQVARIFRAVGCARHASLLVGEGGHRFYPELAWPKITQIGNGWK
ncbi:MAG: alpha/beta hydrolase family protein [Planctomycetota bacterium]